VTVIIYYELRTWYTHIKRRKEKSACTTILQYKISLLLSVQCHIAKVCLMCNSFRITFMFKKSVVYSVPGHPFVDWCKFRKWSSQKSSGMLGITANAWMHSLTEYTLSSNKPNIAVRTVQTFDNKSWTTTGQLDAECWLTFCCLPFWITFYSGSPDFLAMPLISYRYKLIPLGSSRHVSTHSMCRECRAMLF